jgi:thiol-disulfide isomerase/thioredoxin
MTTRTGIAIALAAALLAIALAVRSSMPPPAPIEHAKLGYTLEDMSGAKVDLASFAGRPLVINLWATWCPPCRLEMPQLQALSAKYRDRGLTIVGISVDDAPEDIRKAAAESKITYPMLVGVGHDDFIQSLGYQDVLPLSILIRADGTIAGRVTGLMTTGDWQRKLEALLSAG